MLPNGFLLTATHVKRVYSKALTRWLLELIIIIIIIYGLNFRSVYHNWAKLRSELLFLYESSLGTSHSYGTVLLLLLRL